MVVYASAAGCVRGGACSLAGVIPGHDGRFHVDDGHLHVVAKLRDLAQRRVAGVG